MQSLLLRISSQQMQELDFFADAQNRTRTDVIREAIGSYLAQHKEEGSEKEAADVFGLWKGKNIDALAYQQEMRSEW